MTAAALASLPLRWSTPLYRAAPPQRKRRGPHFPRIDPLVFAGRGLVPIGYAAVAFILDATPGVLIRRTVPAMASIAEGLAPFFFVAGTRPSSGRRNGVWRARKSHRRSVTDPLLLLDHMRAPRPAHRAPLRGEGKVCGAALGQRGHPAGGPDGSAGCAPSSAQEPHCLSGRAHHQHWQSPGVPRPWRG